MTIEALRFAVCLSDGSSSSQPWRVWTTPEGSAYVAIRAQAGVCKVSLHASGDWRYGFTEEYADGRYPDHDGTGIAIDAPIPRSVEGLPEPPERIIRQWRRPEREVYGYVTAIHLAVPLLCCTLPGCTSTRKSPVEYIAAPYDSRLMVTFGVIISGRDDRLGYPYPGPPAVSHCLVGKLPLGDDETLWVVAVVGPLMLNVMEASVGELDRLLSLDGGQRFLDDVTTRRIMCFGYTEDDHNHNTPYLIDLDPLMAVAARIHYLQEHNDPSDPELARLEAFGKEFGRRRRQASAP